jgi:predicted anti-sigma-YlaC factor YlaD
MGDWMGYVYQQQPLPTNFSGVTVTISVTDSNGNTRPIGTATTDASGAYTLTWAPDISGNFGVTASFAGTNSYWPSKAETSFNVMEAHPTLAPTSTPSDLASTQTLEYGIAAIIIVMVIIGAVLALLMLRKRP